MAQTERGFTLIELMIVIAIIGILASIAVPSYLDYVRKANMSEVITTMQTAKTKAVLYYNENGVWPNDNALVGMGDLTDYRTDLMDNLYVRALNGNGQVFAHIEEGKFGATAQSWVRIQMSDVNGIIQFDCTNRENTWPTSEVLLEYIDC